MGVFNGRSHVPRAALSPGPRRAGSRAKASGASGVIRPVYVRRAFAHRRVYAAAERENPLERIQSGQQRVVVEHVNIAPRVPAIVG